MSRAHTSVDPNLPALSGKLGDALRMHAGQRIHYFFMFLYYKAALTDRLNQHLTNAGQGMLSHFDGVSVKATHQIDSGFRDEDEVRWDFLKKDPAILDEYATNCGKSDAAHYCNLGLTDKFQGIATQYATADKDPLAFKYYDRCEVMAGATRQLPQRINIGPDRVIDKLHGELAQSYLGAIPAVTAGNVKYYIEEAKRRMTVYMNEQTRKGYAGLAACCQCYIDCYDSSPKCNSAWVPEGVWQQLQRGIQADCGASQIDPTRYVAS